MSKKPCLWIYSSFVTVAIHKDLVNLREIILWLINWQYSGKKQQTEFYTIFIILCLTGGTKVNGILLMVIYNHHYSTADNFGHWFTYSDTSKYKSEFGAGTSDCPLQQRHKLINSLKLLWISGFVPVKRVWYNSIQQCLWTKPLDSPDLCPQFATASTSIFNERG